MLNSKLTIQKIRQSRTFKGLALLLVMSILTEIFTPTVSLALTEGPSQPEVQSFEPISTTEMVDLFSGDFNYNIPLFNLPGPNGGYPMNLAYHAGVSTDDEASWVGLGWNINPGALVRNMRGLPDEFLSEEVDENGEVSKGDYIKTKTDMKESWTLGVNWSKKIELFGAPAFSDESLSLSMYFNNYRGVGVNAGYSITQDNGYFGWGLSLDGDNGTSVSVSMSLKNKIGNERYKNKFTLSFDGNLSVDYSLSGSEKKEVLTSDSNRGTKLVDKYNSSYGSSISFARDNYMPNVSHNFNSYNVNFNLQLGSGGLGLFNSSTIGGFYNTQDFDKLEKRGIKRKVSGFMRNGDEKLTKNSYLYDYARSNDGMLHKNSVILPYSNYTSDAFVSTGQGLSGYFSAKRNDIGMVFDPYIYNLKFGFSLTLDLSTNAQHLGAGFTVSSGWDSQGPWNSLNDMNMPYFPANVDIENSNTLGIKEMMYLKAHGEQTILRNDAYSHIKNNDLALVKLAPKNSDDLAGGKRRIESSSVITNERLNNSSSRMVRNTLIHSLNNEEVSNIGEFNIKYYEFSNSLDLTSVNGQLTLDRTTRNTNENNIKKHPAGYKVLNQEGSYYVYALPAYNKKDISNSFSVNRDFVNGYGDNQETIDYELKNDEVDYTDNRTNKVLNKTEKSPYAHSYLLTSIQGADYVDVTNNGPSNDDLGYWVKFSYVKKSSDFKWRAPFKNANYSQGNSYDVHDDIASYSYGEKELWYLGRIETKTHVAIFEMDQRLDSRGADSEHNDSSSPLGESCLKINKIKVYDKRNLESSNPKPLQTIHFDYDYSLCKGSLNSAAPDQGKLTLKKIWFTSNDSKRVRNKYEFDYGQVNPEVFAGLPNPSSMQNLVNPNYSSNSIDPWGNYKPLNSSTYGQHVRFPYTSQFNQHLNSSTNNWDESWSNNLIGDAESAFNKSVHKRATDLKASAWCLRKVTLPSGGEVNIEYESDDYGYVQHKTANQMFKVDGFSAFSDKPDILYENLNDPSQESDYSSASTRKIFFKLENPIPVSSTNVNNKIYNDYVEPIIKDEMGRRNLYIKTRIALTPDLYEFVSGYLELEDSPDLCGVKNENVENIVLTEGGPSVNCYTTGFVTIKKARKKKESNGFYEKYHPLSMLAWDYMQTNAQEILTNPNSFDTDDEGSDLTTSDVLGKMFDIINILPGTMQSFGAIRPYCKSKGFGRKVDLEKTCIRLASPDKIKFGGGHRVKKITIKDNWTADSGNDSDSRTYGQVFDYTINENGKVISSGVAQYEPQLGGDENALKYPIHFAQKINLVSSARTSIEAPVNESLFPGASVGYRKVTVKSLNTETQLKNIPEEQRGRVGGISVHEFYTAKEFPTFVDFSTLSEEENTKDIFMLPILIPLIGSIKRNYFHGTQAFKIELNDMHGKPKSVKTYEINNYEVGTDPITEASYEYQMKSRMYQGENVFELDNSVNIIADNDTHNFNPSEQRQMGVEIDLSTDQRETKSVYTTGGLDFNLDLPLPIIGVPNMWPTINNSKSMTRTYVTNKVIHKSGILKKTKTRDLQTVNESEIIAYDEKSGIPLLSRIKNEFGDDFYSYNIPAYYEYNGMGHAYQNINYTFAKKDLYKQDGIDGKIQPYFEFDASEEDLKYLIRGDELLTINSKTDNTYKKLYFLGWRYTNSSPTGVRGMLGTCANETYNVDAENAGNIEGDLSTHTWFKVIRSGHRNQFGVSIANYLTKDKLSTNLSGTQLLEDADGVQISTPKIGNNVLSATASLYRDDWNQSIYGLTTESVTTSNPFLSGNSGIWRPYKSYTYVGERSSNQSMNNNVDADAKLYQDGVMSNVPMFSWELGNMENYVSNWEWVSEVTRYSPDAYELENVNRIGVYSSALYGYNNSLSIGVGSNSAYNEIGTMDFEFLPSDANSSFRKVLNQTNLNFASAVDVASNVIFEHFNIISSQPVGSGESFVIIKTTIPYNDYISGIYDTRKVGLVLHNKKLTTTSSDKTSSVYFNGTVIDVATSYNVGGVLYTQLKVNPFLNGSGSSNQYFKTGSRLYGKISLPINRALAQESKAVSFASNKAHTGKKSMKVNAESLFEQVNIKLVAGKKYIYSMWISRDNDVVRTYEDGNNLFELGFLSGGVSTYTALTPLSVKYSKVIEGWQKVDVEFVATNSANVLGVKFKSAGLYVDDIRISPKTGGLATYVYNPINYWLNATLNANNYATFYYYDEEGNLHLKKQETEEGIFTITESRGYVPNN